MPRASSASLINTYAIFLSFLFGCAVGIWSAVGVVLFAKQIAEIVG